MPHCRHIVTLKWKTSNNICGIYQLSCALLSSWYHLLSWSRYHTVVLSLSERGLSHTGSYVVTKVDVPEYPTSIWTNQSLCWQCDRWSCNTVGPALQEMSLTTLYGMQMMFKEVSILNSIYCSRRDSICEENALIILSQNENEFQICQIMWYPLYTDF